MINEELGKHFKFQNSSLPEEELIVQICLFSPPPQEEELSRERDILAVQTRFSVIVQWWETMESQ